MVPFITKLFSLSGKNITYRIKNIKKNTIRLKSGEQFEIPVSDAIESILEAFGPDED